MRVRALLIGLLCLVAVAAEPLQRQELGLAVNLPSGWVSETASGPDEAFYLRSEDKACRIEVLLEDASSQSLRGLVTNLRYGIVVVLEGHILAEKKVRVAGTDAVELNFEAPGEGRCHWLVAQREGKLLRIRAQAPPARQAELQQAYSEVLGSLDWEAPQTEPTP